MLPDSLQPVFTTKLFVCIICSKKWYMTRRISPPATDFLTAHSQWQSCAEKRFDKRPTSPIGCTHWPEVYMICGTHFAGYASRKPHGHARIARDLRATPAWDKI